MRVIITAGGTGGHIYPALAIISKIKEYEPDSEFLYIGTHNRMEKDIIPSRGIKYEALEIYGLSLSIKLMPRNIKNVFLIKKAINKCIKLIDDFKPDIVIGVGGYVTYPVIKAANKCHVKTFIHEQNSIPGKSNLALAKNVDLIGVSFKESLNFFKSSKAFLSGNPVSENNLNIKTIPRTKFGCDYSTPLILIVSGSLGSQAINNIMINFLSIERKEQIIYVTGKSFFNEFSKNKFPSNVHVVPFIDGMSGLLADVDCLITRAGATSIAEITAAKCPSILIPSPYVANNHQFYNAKSIVDNEAGLMIEEKDLTIDTLERNIDLILNDKKMVEKFKKNLNNICIKDSASIIYNKIKEII